MVHIAAIPGTIHMKQKHAQSSKSVHQKYIIVILFHKKVHGQMRGPSDKVI